MKCPRCGKEMEHGYAEMSSGAAGPQGVMFAFTTLRWKGDTTHSKEQLFSTQIGGVGAMLKIEAYRCPDCKVVAFSYEKTTEFQEETKAENYDYKDIEKYLR